MCCAQPSFLRNNNLFNKSQTFCWSLLLKTVQSAAIKLYLTCPFGCFPVFNIKLPITRILRKLNLIKKNSVNDTLDFFFPSYFPICVSLSRHISLHISLHLQKLTRRDLCVLSHTNQSSAPPSSSWLLLPSLLLIAMSGRGRKVRWQRGRRAEHHPSPPSPNHHTSLLGGHNTLNTDAMRRWMGVVMCD